MRNLAPVRKRAAWLLLLGSTLTSIVYLGVLDGPWLALHVTVIGIAGAVLAWWPAVTSERRLLARGSERWLARKRAEREQREA